MSGLFASSLTCHLVPLTDPESLKDPRLADTRGVSCLTLKEICSLHVGKSAKNNVNIQNLHFLKISVNLKAAQDPNSDTIIISTLSFALHLLHRAGSTKS